MSSLQVHTPARATARGVVIGLGLLLVCGVASVIARADDAPTATGLSLSECIEIALQSNPRIDISNQSIVSAQSSLRKLRSNYSPKLTLSAAEGIQSRGTTQVGDGSSHLQQADATLRWTFWDSGRRDDTDQSRARLEVAEYNFEDAVRALVEQVATNYYSVLAAQELLGVADLGVEYATQNLAHVRRRIEVGEAAAVDIHSAEEDLAQAQLDLIDARSTVRTALAQLRNSMGVSMATDLTLSGEAGEWNADIPPLQTAFADAVQARPDILSAEAGIRAQQYALSAARAAGKPIYSLGGQASKPFDGWDAGDEDWSVSAEVSWALFDGGANASDRQNAEASLASARATLLQMHSEVALELENGLVELQRSAERVTAAEKSFEAARAQLGATQAKYQNGLAILLEVTQARRTFTSAGATRVRARYDYSVALVALHSAMGTLPVPGAGTSAAEEPAHD